MFLGDREELIDSLSVADGILFPEQVMQEHSHSVHPDALGPTKFVIDLGEVER
jgi:hypothetical protein